MIIGAFHLTVKLPLTWLYCFFGGYRSLSNQYSCASRERSVPVYTRPRCNEPLQGSTAVRTSCEEDLEVFFVLFLQGIALRSALLN